MHKKQITTLAFKCGCSAHYCGKEKKFYFTAMGYDEGLPTVVQRMTLTQYGTFKGFADITKLRRTLRAKKAA